MVISAIAVIVRGVMNHIGIVKYIIISKEMNTL